jgi:hypothetical protein
MLASWLVAVLVKRAWNDRRLAGTDRPDSDSRWVSSEPVPYISTSTPGNSDFATGGKGQRAMAPKKQVQAARKQMSAPSIQPLMKRE